MFKRNNAQDPVRHILEGIAYAIRLPNLEPNPTVLSKPTFMCVGPNTGSPLHYLYGLDLSAQCAHGIGQAFYVMGGSYIFLCPTFWLAPVAPPTPACPSVFGNIWPESAAHVASYLTYVLIHELAHFYLGTGSLGMQSVPSEVYPINGCVALDRSNSIRNPQNYQYYVARKYCVFLNILGSAAYD